MPRAAASGDCGSGAAGVSVKNAVTLVTTAGATIAVGKRADVDAVTGAAVTSALLDAVGAESLPVGPLMPPLPPPPPPKNTAADAAAADAFRCAIGTGGAGAGPPKKDDAPPAVGALTLSLGGAAGGSVDAAADAAWGDCADGDEVGAGVRSSPPPPPLAAKPKESRGSEGSD